VPDPDGGAYPLFDSASWLKAAQDNASWNSASWLKVLAVDNAANEMGGEG